jgi:hypothetical protein
VGTIAAGVVNLLATGISIPLIERLGRRTLILTGISGMGLSTGGLVAALSLYIGSASNYGDGGAYFAPNGSLTSEVVPVVEACLALGLLDEAANITSYYFEHFVRADGSLPELDDCAAGGFGDALADVGEELESFARVARAQAGYNGAAGAAWVQAHVPAFARLANFSLRLRLNATAADATDATDAALGAARDPATVGLVFGSPEHDTCHEPDYYVHNNAWLVRGMFEAASLLADAGGTAYADLAAALAAEAPRFAADLARSVALSAVPLPGGLVFHPPIAASGSVGRNPLRVDDRVDPRVVL